MATDTTAPSPFILPLIRHSVFPHICATAQIPHEETLAELGRRIQINTAKNPNYYAPIKYNGNTDISTIAN